MYLKNNAARLITISLKGKTIKLIPSKSIELSAKEYDEVKNNKVFKAWLKDGDIKEVEVKDPLNADMFRNNPIEKIGNFYNIKELKEFAKSIELQGYTNLGKDELLEAIKEFIEN